MSAAELGVVAFLIVLWYDLQQLPNTVNVLFSNSAAPVASQRCRLSREDTVRCQYRNMALVRAGPKYV